MIELNPFLLTAKLALISTAILFVISVPVAYWLAYSKFRLKFILEALVNLPLILPPSVLGFYLLILFSPESTLGAFIEKHLDTRLVFTFQGLIIASIIYSLPFMIQPFHTGFKMIPPIWSDVSYTLGKSKMTTFFRVLLPNMKGSLLAGCILAFAHTIGEFGIVLMIGGSIPGETKVVSIALYDEVQAMHYDAAGQYAIVLLVFSFVVLATVYLINQHYVKAHRYD